jgi:hypothetical protein
MRNLADKVSTDLWPEFEARATACYEAPSRAIVRQLTAGIRADYADLLPSALACFEDFEACIAHLKLPVTHRRFRQGDESPRTAVRRGAQARSRHHPLADPETSYPPPLHPVGSIAIADRAGSSGCRERTRTNPTAAELEAAGSKGPEFH